MNPAPKSGVSGGTQRPPNGALPVKRKKPSSDPFFSGPKTRLPLTRPKTNGQSLPKSNGHLTPPVPQVQTSSRNAERSIPTSRKNIPPSERVSGFSDPQVVSGAITHRDYKLVTSKRDLLQGLRFHILQLAGEKTGDKTVDIRNESEFPKPARLHRRDPYATTSNEVKEEFIEPKDGLNAAERDEANRRKEIRQKEREANLAQIAPSQSSARKVPQFKKKSQQVFRADLTEEDKRRIQTNYEEKLPWHLEDFDGKHCLVGKNQAGSTNMHVAFVYEAASGGAAGKFRLVPIEKHYQFKPKKDYKYMNIEEAEAAMNSKKPKLPAWLEDVQSKRTDERMKEMAARQAKTLFSGGQMSNIAGRQGEEADLDFDEDFADDEEGPIHDGDKDEDEKLAEKKIKEDLLKANIFDMKLAKEYDEEEEKEKLEELARKEGSRKIRKALERRERNFNHGSDSEDDSDTDSEEERERLEQEKLQNAKNDAAEDGKVSAIPSGTNTPSGRKEKHSGTASDREGGMKKSISNKSLKRPGSPNLSDASGTDTSTRKKHKSRHMASSQPALGISRPHSPANVPSSSAPHRPRVARAGSGSDVEMGAQSDRDPTSDGERRRIKLRITSPGASRPASPGPSQSAGQALSRPSSTAPGDTSTKPPDTPHFPTVDDIRTEIDRPGGATIKSLLRLVRNQPESRKREFVVLVQSVAKLNKETKVLEMKDQAS